MTFTRDKPVKTERTSRDTWSLQEKLEDRLITTEFADSDIGKIIGQQENLHVIYQTLFMFDQ